MDSNKNNNKNGKEEKGEYGFRAIVFTDIRKSSELWRLYSKEMSAALDEHERRMQKFSKLHNGTIIKTIGDAFMVVFGKGEGSESESLNRTDKYDTIKDAVDMALHVQSNLKKDPIRVGPKERIQIRAGIAYGVVNVKEVMIQNYPLIDYFGPIVNIASRMESSVSPVGGIAIALDPLNPLDEEIQLSIKNWSSSVTPVSITDNCQGYQSEVVKRSTRLLNVRDYRCQSTESVKGVGRIEALKIMM